MSRRLVLSAAPGLITTASAYGQISAPSLRVPRLNPVPSDAEILAALQSRIDVEKRGVGLVVGIVDAAAGRRTLAYGRLARGGSARVDGETLFEIGSITKTFTSLLLTDSVRRGEVKLDDALAKYVPRGVRVPEKDGRQITLADLATHTSGLPSRPPGFNAADPTNPWADYTIDQLYASLGESVLQGAVGVGYTYSNFGIALLGQALAEGAVTSYETLMQRRVLEPLRMLSTTFTVRPAAARRFATGYDARLNPVPHWEFASIAPAGGLHSSANDMLALLEVECGLRSHPLNIAMADQLRVRRPADEGDQALGWHLKPYEDGEIAWHAGATGGFQSFAGFDRERRMGVVVLSNTAVLVGNVGLYALGGGRLGRFFTAGPPS
jgi:CubicO group peptidase (beta-lactamase class C family)